MKLLRCIIQPYKLDDLRAALEAFGVMGMTVHEVKGHGRQKGHTEVYRGSEYHVSFMPKIMIEIAVPDEQTEPVISKIIETVRTGRIGDGKIFVSTLDDAIRIRTGERGPDAL
ncbi:MAG: P-II family nitrogen regulator [Candidatus Sumerlaeia bacterium]|nr:P-II family nitrogen regulator [Candidatus Sumerlaeia bacterium]